MDKFSARGTPFNTTFYWRGWKAPLVCLRTKTNCPSHIHIVSIGGILNLLSHVVVRAKFNRRRERPDTVITSRTRTVAHPLLRYE